MQKAWPRNPTRWERPHAQHVCLVCAAARRAERNPHMDAAVALSLSAEMELEGVVPAKFTQAVVSSFVRLTEQEALELLRQVPQEAYLGDEDGADCPLEGRCEFRGVLLQYLPQG